MRTRLGRMEAFDALLEELTAEVLASEAATLAASDRHPEALYAGARMRRGLTGEHTDDRHPLHLSPPCETGCGIAQEANPGC